MADTPAVVTVPPAPVSPVPAPKPVVTPPVPKPSPVMVVLKNRLAQSINCTYMQSGGMIELKLGPRGSSAPVPKDSLTAYTKGLIASGHLTALPKK